MKSWFANLVKNWIFPSRVKKQHIDDIPENYESDTIYLVGEINPWLITFLCPCGCQSVIHLNLIPDENPSWRFRVKNRKLSIYPSIRRLKGCKSHFWITSSKVFWSKY